MTEPICPSDVIIHPRVIANAAGRTSLHYRAGDYASFRHALLRPRPGEQALLQWRPPPRGDLAAQLVEWWAYLADVLTFYNERAVHEMLLRTATLPESVRRIVRLLGYRPRPAIGATGVVAALADAARPFLIERGFPIQGNVGRTKPPQVFEVDESTEVGLLGRPLPSSAGIPQLPEASSWSGYAARDGGRLRNSLPAFRKRPTKLPVKRGKPIEVAVAGVTTTLKPNDVVVLLKKGWTGAEGESAMARVDRVAPTWDERGVAVTRFHLQPGHDLPDNATVIDYKLVKPTKLAHLWLYHNRYPGPKNASALGGFLQGAEQFFDPLGVFSGGVSSEPVADAHVLTSHPNPDVPTARGQAVAHLEAITRGIAPGDPVLFEQKRDFGALADTLRRMFGDVVGDAFAAIVKQLERSAALVKVGTYSETIWYANPPEGDRIGQGPPIGPPSSGLLKKGQSAIPIPHTQITFVDHGEIADTMSEDDEQIDTVVVHYGWQEVGEILEAGPPENETKTPQVPATPHLPPGEAPPVLIEDSTGAGVIGHVGRDNDPGPSLAPPLQALLNLLPVSRGQTVVDEVLGSGEPMLIHQEFKLQRAPLTYLRDNGPQAPNGYRSTLRVRVGGIEWHEVPSFYDLDPDARVFVTREDDAQNTYVRFGDGEFGARLPAGIDNVVATYRFGAGAETPPVGALTTILRPQPGLTAIRNPVAVRGGEDPDPPAQIRRYAPRSVLAMGRAISGDDYETIAAQTPGVKRATVRWGWDAAAQRSLVKVYVGDDTGAVKAAREALRAVSDPNRPIFVALASPRLVDVTLTVIVHPDYVPDAVRSAVIAMLLDPMSQPLGDDVVRIEEPIYDSQIYDVCMNVQGVVAVHALVVRVLDRSEPLLLATPVGFSGKFPVGAFSFESREVLRRDRGERHAPGEGRFFLLHGDRLHVGVEVGRGS